MLEAAICQLPELSIVQPLIPSKSSNTVFTIGIDTIDIETLVQKILFCCSKISNGGYAYRAAVTARPLQICVAAKKELLTKTEQSESQTRELDMA